VGVPGVVWADELLPPHPAVEKADANKITGARRGSHFRFRSNRHPEPSNITAQTIGGPPEGKSIGGTAPVVVAAIVPTFTVTGCELPPLI